MDCFHPEWKSNVLGQITSWFKDGLKDRAVTRDLPWGVNIPEEIALSKNIDADGKVLEKGNIYNSGFRSGTSKHRPHKGRIERTFEMPLETTHIAFQSSWQPRLGR